MCREGKKATEAREKLRRVYGRNVIKKRQCQNWFARFHDSDFSVKDAHCSDRPSKIDDDEMKALVQANKHSTIRKLAAALKVSAGNVHDHLKSLGFVKKLDVWVPHELKEIHLMNRMNVCDQFIKREENDPFLKCMGDEKWIVYNNVSRKRSWSRRSEAPERQAKDPPKGNAVMWWDWKGPVFYELLSKNKMINSDVYCEQLQKLSDAIAQKRPELINLKGVMFHLDNARPHTSLVTRQNCCNMVGMCYHIYRIAQTLHHQTSISFVPCKTPW
ncbi:PREDICTED: histone-lysine N-methyltransferase SETMAR-like [Atta cephalotes]|uniref:Mos1 transposase HTH domain-containing protein n=1 Tax=Atta cephalotes TaxID=12957 RepID=A0A158NVH8_ATTCE|nr:PREDICTED: histone-lysine N-methyltransferase SETMAR-like [Atta cephalotes]